MVGIWEVRRATVRLVSARVTAAAGPGLLLGAQCFCRRGLEGWKRPGTGGDGCGVRCQDDAHAHLLANWQHLVEVLAEVHPRRLCGETEERATRPHPHHLEVAWPFVDK